ncbi:MAG TPA: DNA translocase FtsK, partial [Ruminococcaceae bacterium]|nr:DNA translocase FtsK [Oscillospiraceae bacterium]
KNKKKARFEHESEEEDAEKEDGFVPPNPDEMSKTNPKYKRPESGKVFRTSESDDFFNDHYDPVPEKRDEVFTPTDENEEQPEIPNFTPMPNVFDYQNTTKADEASAEKTAEQEFASEQESVSSQDVVDLIDKAASVKEDEKPIQETLEEPEAPKKQYILPGVNCLAESISGGDTGVKEELTANAAKLVETLHNFNIETKIVDIARGPSVTRYEIQPAPGIKISRIAGLADDIAMNLAASGVRIEAPIPNKAAVGIEIPNKIRTTVTLREIIDSPQFKTAKSKLNVALGKDISGNVTCTDIAKMPHLLIAGTTGSGKSVCLNSMIISILFNSTPDEVKLIMIDPKQVEFTVYNGIPHLMVPVVSDARKAAGALAWAVSEMLKRYKMFSEKGVRDIKGYNKLAERTPDMTPMYQICIFIDELSDLMMVAANEVEDSICRLAQMARAAGMHLVIATQRPSVDVITGIIKANIPSRIALYVSSQVDSRTILDASGADKLLGNGDMLFNPVGVSKPVRLQGCFVSDEEVESVVNFIKTQEECDYDSEVMEEIERQAVLEKKKGNPLPDADSSPDSGADKETMDAIAVVVENQTASTTLLQRKLKIGYAKAARIMDELEEKGVIGPFEGSKPRKVLMTKQQFIEMRALNDDGAVVSSEDGE